MTEIILNIDEQFLLWCNGSHTPWLDTIWWWISGRWTWVPLYALLTYFIFRQFTLRSAILILLTVGLTITLSDQISSHVLRDWVGRLRPSNPDNPISASIQIVNSYRSGRYGFPSSHAANTFALATLLSLLFQRRWFTITIFAWAVIVCGSRLYLGVHYPTDLLAGACLGAFIASVCFMLLVRFFNIQRRPSSSTCENS